MFGLSKPIKAEDIPFSELTMLYVGHNCGGLSTPEDYLVSYIHAHEAMVKRFDEEESPRSVNMPKVTPTVPSYWKRF